MPRRSESHITADLAVHAVQGLLIRIGWACESIGKDYGEDLVAQPTRPGSSLVEPFKVWLQVKGTTDSSVMGRGEYVSITSSVAHGRKWANSLDPCAFVIWDVEAGTGWYGFPGIDFDVPGYELEPFDAWRVRIPRANILATHTMEKFGWTARFHHYYGRIHSGAAFQHEFDGPSRDSMTDTPAYSAAHDLLLALGLVFADGREYSVSALASQRFDSAYRHCREGGKSHEDARTFAAILTVASFVDDTGAKGVPAVPLSYLAHALLIITARKDEGRPKVGPNTP